MIHSISRYFRRKQLRDYGTSYTWILLFQSVGQFKYQGLEAVGEHMPLKIEVAPKVLDPGSGKHNNRAPIYIYIYIGWTLLNPEAPTGFLPRQSI
jgi:hypothetical protein